jgi:hypothetical protein
MRNQARIRRLELLEKMVKEEVLKKRANISHDVIFEDNDYTKNVSKAAPPTPLLKLKIRNTTKYLNWASIAQ